ncbi:MAG: HlyD family efflux transporter periplasmic adaptor subunit [Moorea sp. SIOASIH]|uniref:HlyD family efflux transporter periplasmic adaptor subunit n=1 Tax=Moorena sp. SIOASIH TaxID=2607817 RepID=UPI0013BB0398|nr:HlyD family efflux transporter periplasmic adaptor subunit [Moorena sp. SIOASIH]NEO37371.1 HlyD family efflux transporter periplasmic adaptor subunit [Moorena sp. SIOASIH]
MVSTPKTDFLPAVQENDFLPPISRWSTLGGLFLVGAMGVAVTLTCVTKYKITVKAQAIFRPAGELRLVQAPVEGSVIKILVAENQMVQKGDVIATIDDSRLQTKKSQLQNNQQQAQLQLIQINAQIRALDRQIVAETDRSKLAVASAEAELSRSRRQYQDRLLTTVTEVEEAAANLRFVQEELQQAVAQLKSTQANLRSTESALKAAKSRRKRYQSISASGALSQNQLEEAELAVDQQQQTVEAQKAAVEAQKQRIDQQKQAVDARRARLQRVQAALNPSNAEVAIAQQRIAQEQAIAKATLATLNREKEALIQQRIEIQNQQSQDTRELEQVEIELRQTVIKSPEDGTIFQLALRNSGQTVKHGEEIAQIAPSNTSLLVKALVPARDIGKVEINQAAQLRVSACPYPDYGTLNGVVNKIAPDATTLQSNSITASRENRGSAFYQVTIAPESLVLGKGNKQCAIQLGMEGRADIITREETVLQFLLRKARLITDV